MNDKFTIKLQVIEEAFETIFNPENQAKEKMKGKKELFLMKIPLLSLIYQKKGTSNFQIILNNIRLLRTEFGEIIFNTNQNRTFNIVLRGFVMLFIKDKHGGLPKFYKKMTPGEHFGQKMIFGKEEVESARSVSQGYVLQMDIKPFYHAFAGHFQYEELKEKVHQLKTIWVFSHTKLALLQRILLSSENRKYVRGDCVFKEGEKAHHLIVIVNGEITLSALKDGKLKSFSIVTKLQVYGVEEITQNKTYSCTGICTSDYAQILKVDREIVEEIFEKELLASMIDSRKRLSTQLKESCLTDSRRLLAMSSISRGRPIERRRSTLEHSRARSEISPFSYQPLNKIEIQNGLFKKDIQLKYNKIREVRQQFIKNNQKNTLYSTKRISSYINKECTYDKQIILNYLERKQKRYQQALRKELEFQGKKILVGPELKVDRSSAVKNVKRKLKNSRKQHCLSLQNI